MASLPPPAEVDLLTACVRQLNDAVCWYLAVGRTGPDPERPHGAIPASLVEADYLVNTLRDTVTRWEDD